MGTRKKPSKGCVTEKAIANRQKLFKQHVEPNLNLVYKLCIQYSFSDADVEDNYIEVLINFYKYIETYDPSKSIQTWLHIVTKRFVNDMNYKNSRFKRNNDIDISRITNFHIGEGQDNELNMQEGNYGELYSDEILTALESLKPIYREALLLQQAGYKLNQIMEITYKNGTLKAKNIETVKSRLFLAKQQMREMITRDGEARTD
ncbi:MAG: sigma-70 family RNA polymerase sigma factor [Prevotella sp.]|nr:sigma-70 family RNA polymerase sigma factor [Prevotella sp.]